MRQITGLLVIFLVLMSASTIYADQAVRGTVYETDGSPAVNARIWACLMLHDPKSQIHGVTDEHGNFSLRLNDGLWLVHAMKDSTDETITDSYCTVDVRSGKPIAPLNIKMVERGKLTGKVTAADTGEPIAGAKLYLSNGKVITTDQAGRYEVSGLTRAARHLHAEAKGYERTRILFDTTDHPETKLDIELKPGGRLIGTVLDEGGKPIDGAYVSRPTSGDTLLSRSPITLKSVPNRSEQITLNHNFYAPRFVPVDPGMDPLPMNRHTPGARLLGRIVNERGEPLTDICAIPLIASPD